MRAAARSILPNTGVWVVRNGQWQQSIDPEVSVGGVWTDSYESLVQVGGTWKTSYLRPLPTTLTITSPDVSDKIAGIDQFSGSFTGTAVDVLGRPVNGGLISVERYRDGALDQLETIVATDASGNWSWAFDEGQAAIADIGEWNYRFTLAENLPLLSESVDSPSFRVNSASVQLTITSQPSGNVDLGYDTWTESGTAFREDASVAPGTVYTSWSIDNGTWSTEQSATVDASGNWTTGTQGPFGVAGQRRLRVRYEALPGGFEDPAEVFGNTVTAVPRATTFTKGSISNTSIAMSCPSRTSVTGYQFYEGGTQRQSGSGKSYTRSGLSNYGTYYNFKVRTYATSPAGTTYYSAFSSEHDARTGRPTLTDSGTSSEKVISPSATGSWRTASNNVWGQRGDKVLQGVYIGNSQYGYFRGLIDFGSSGVYNIIKSHLGGGTTGDNRITHGSATYCQVYLWKNPGVGTSGAVKIRWFRTNTAAGSNPGTVGSAYDQTSATGGNGSWVSVGTTHGTEVVKNKNRGFCMIYDSTASDRYAEFNGRSSGTYDCRIRMKWTWSYTTQTAASGVWLN